MGRLTLRGYIRCGARKLEHFCGFLGNLQRFIQNGQIRFEYYIF